MKRRAIELCVFAALVGACGAETPEVDSVPDYPTYTEHIRPFLAEHCVLCHGATPRSGAPGNFRLDVYDDTRGKKGARSMAFPMAEVLERGEMPPDGEGVGPNARKMFRRWAELGAPQRECAPSCEGRACGDDGCGGSCGSCGDGLACQEGECAPEEDGTPDLQQVWRKIIEPRCASCHGSGDNGLKMGASAKSFYGAVVGVASLYCSGRPYVAPGDPDASYLLQKVKGSEGVCGVRMPYGQAPLSAEQIALLRDWIAAGAPK